MRNGCNIDNVGSLCSIMLIINHFLRTYRYLAQNANVKSNPLSSSYLSRVVPFMVLPAFYLNP